MKMNFRYSSESDSDEIQSLFTSVFRNSEGETEGAVIGKLTRDLLEKTEKNDLIVFVATIAAEIKGAIIVTRMPSEESFGTSGSADRIPGSGHWSAFDRLWNQRAEKEWSKGSGHLWGSELLFKSGVPSCE
jgi:hypothetical protein